MAKGTTSSGDDLLTSPGEVKKAKVPQGNVVLCPDPKVGILIRYHPGKKEEAIQEAFEMHGDDGGILSVVQDIGHSRKYPWGKLPTTNTYVPGHGGTGHMFVKFEPLT